MPISMQAIHAAAREAKAVASQELLKSSSKRELPVKHYMHMCIFICAQASAHSASYEMQQSMPKQATFPGRMRRASLEGTKQKNPRCAGLPH